jgi:hypothetical protein
MWSSMWTTRYILRDIHDLIAEIKFYIKRYDITALQPITRLCLSLSQNYLGRTSRMW